MGLSVPLFPVITFFLHLYLIQAPEFFARKKVNCGLDLGHLILQDKFWVHLPLKKNHLAIGKEKLSIFKCHLEP